jgi:hypothetical protein
LHPNYEIFIHAAAKGFKIIISGSFVEIGDVASPHWQRGHKLVMWHHPVGREVTGYNPYPLRTGLPRWAHEGYGDGDNGIHPRH